jgi:hypothetical protein
MTDKRLADMTPDDLRRNWERDHSTCHLWTHIHALIQRATREADERWRKQVAETESSTIAALREQVAGFEPVDLMPMLNAAKREALSILADEMERERIVKSCGGVRVFRDQHYPAPVEAAPSVEGYSLEVNAPNAPDTITVKHNGKPVFTVALATGGGR